MSSLYTPLPSAPAFNSPQPIAQAGNWFGIPSNDISNVLPILSGITGAIPTPTSGSSSTNSNSNIQTVLSTLQNLLASSSTSGTQSQTNGYGAAGNALITSILPVLTGLMSKSTNLNPYIASSSEQINKNANIQKQAAANIMAARGLASSPVAASTEANIDAQRVAGITNLQNQAPLLQQQLTTSALQNAGGILSQLPKVSTGTTAQTGTSTQSAENSQAGTTNTVGNSNVNQQQKSGGGVGGFLGGLTSVLAHLFG